jgi:very-short-patch-repair endonuclease
VATTAALLAACTEREIRAARSAGRIVRLRRGVYALPAAHAARETAARLSGTVTHLSAAQQHGWEVLYPPEFPWVAVPRKRAVTQADLESAVVVWSTATGPITDPLRTVLDCARRLSYIEGLAVADSALRHGDVAPLSLHAAAARVRGPGAPKVRRVARDATPLAANPLETALRAICREVPGLSVRPQVPIALPDFTVRPDLVDERLRIVVEVEGWTYHAQRETFARDVERYTLLVADDWLVARFWTEQILRRPDYVRDTLARLVAVAQRRRGCVCPP